MNRRLRQEIVEFTYHRMHSVGFVGKDILYFEYFSVNLFRKSLKISGENNERDV